MTAYFFKTDFNTFACRRMCMCLQSGIVISDFKIKILYEFIIIIPLHTTRPANQLLLDFITIIMADGEYKL